MFFIWWRIQYSYWRIFLRTLMLERCLKSHMFKRDGFIHFECLSLAQQEKWSTYFYIPFILIVMSSIVPLALDYIVQTVAFRLWTVATITMCIESSKWEKKILHFAFSNSVLCNAFYGPKLFIHKWSINPNVWQFIKCLCADSFSLWYLLVKSLNEKIIVLFMLWALFPLFKKFNQKLDLITRVNILLAYDSRGY